MGIAYVLIVAIHIIACIVLIAVILLQAGRGGGLAETFSVSDSIFGTKTSSFLQKATTACAITFIITCLVLAYLTAQGSKSLVGKRVLNEKMIPLQSEPIPATEATVPASMPSQPEQATQNLPETPKAEPITQPAK